VHGFDCVESATSTCLKGESTKLKSTDPQPTLSPDDFVDGRLHKTFYFGVMVRNAVKPTRLKGTAVQAVQLSGQPVLHVFTDCLSNCGQLMNPTYRLVLAAQCKICHNMSYTWQLNVSAADSNITVKTLQPEDTLNGLREPVLNVNPHVFASTSSETYEIILTGQSVSQSVSQSVRLSTQINLRTRTHTLFQGPFFQVILV